MAHLFGLGRGPLWLRKQAEGSLTVAGPRLNSRRNGLGLVLSVALSCSVGSIRVAPAQPAPHLSQSHGATQIVVDGKPFLVSGGELENSSASSLAYLDTIWPKVIAMHFNTLLAPSIGS